MVNVVILYLELKLLAKNHSEELLKNKKITLKEQFL